MPNGRIVNRAIHCQIVTSGGSPVEIEDTMKANPKAINPKAAQIAPTTDNLQIRGLVSASVSASVLLHWSCN
jgi:hypothetical protein